MKKYIEHTYSTKEIIKIICDKCGKEINKNDFIEFQEVLSIHFTGGYGSIFGDGTTCSCDLCQKCVKEILGKFLKLNNEYES